MTWHSGITDAASRISASVEQMAEVRLMGSPTGGEINETLQGNAKLRRSGAARLMASDPYVVKLFSNCEGWKRSTVKSITFGCNVPFQRTVLLSPLAPPLLCPRAHERNQRSISG
jgi:hypothetical protein